MRQRLRYENTNIATELCLAFSAGKIYMDWHALQIFSLYSHGFGNRENKGWQICPDILHIISIP